MSTYKDLKNHVHNTLKITKEEIREIVESTVEKVVERRVDVLLRDKLNVQHLVDHAIEQKINENNWFWDESEDKLDDYIKKEMVRKLTDGVKLKVEVVGKKSDATQTGDRVMKIRKNK